MSKPALAIALVALAAGGAVAGTRSSAGEPAAGAAGGSVALTRWTLREDPRDRGLSLGWQAGRFGGRPVTVPNTLRAQEFTGPGGSRNYAGSVAWYETSFQETASGPYALSFRSANYRADVWLDGRRLGSHRGSYLPFELRSELAAGTHVLVVRIDWRDPARQAREGFHRTWFNWGGLNGQVDVRPIAGSELSAPSLQTTLAAGGEGEAPAATVKVGVNVLNTGPERQITPEGALRREGQSIALHFAPLTLAHGEQATATATATVPSPALWSPSSPNLYELDLGADGVAGYAARVGLRQLTWRGGRLYLNGHRLLLHGATIQQDAPAHADALSGADEDAIVAELKAIKANVARAQHPLDAGLLERLDAAGILLWQGIGPVEGAGNWYSTTPRLLAEAEQQARTAVLAEQLHPSVVAWNLVDEVAGNGRDAAETRYVQALTAWLHRNDPTRPVAVDVWGDHPPRQAGPLYAGVDAIAETDYSGWYDNPHASAGQLAAQMRARLAAMKSTFPGRILAISEFGAESNTLNAPSAPGGYLYQARLLAAHISVYAADPRLSGMMIWLLRDYPLNPTFQGGSIHFVLPHVRLIEGLNQKGLFTRSGHAKPAVATVRRAFAALPSG